MNTSRNWFSELAGWASHATGRAPAFAMAVAVPMFGFSDTWQLVINTGTTIVTFLMVFLIQNSQNRDSAAIQVKLDELIRTGQVRNAFVGIEHLTDEELDELRRKTEARAARQDPGKAVHEIDRKAADAAERITR